MRTVLRMSCGIICAAAALSLNAETVTRRWGTGPRGAPQQATAAAQIIPQLMRNTVLMILRLLLSAIGIERVRRACRKRLALPRSD